jgi:lipid-binding SYLF domain-containing protein
MKTMMLGMIMLGVAGTALADTPGELDGRIQTLTARLEAMQQNPAKRVPAEVIRTAQGIVLLDHVKAGFLFAYQDGDGIALVKNPDTGEWSAPAFVDAGEASLGLQIGGEKSFVVMLFMNTNATRALIDAKFAVGAEARGTAGDASGGTETIPYANRPILVYDDRKGFFGGVDLKAGSITPNHTGNRSYYGQGVSMKDILFDNKVKRTASAQALARDLIEFSKGSVVSKNTKN